MENTTSQIPPIEEITQVYKHRKNKDGGCRCGCLGSYWTKDGTKKHDRMIKKIYGLIKENIKDATIAESYIDVWIVNRFYTMYFSETWKTRLVGPSLEKIPTTNT